MKGYRKISEGCVTGWPDICEEDNGYLDDQIRGVIHGPIIEEMQRRQTKEFFVVLYRKVPHD